MALGIKHIWTEKEVAFIKENWSIKTNKELAGCLGLKVTLLRTKLYSMGLYKMRLEYWTKEQICFLRANYKLLGDTELASIFNERWKKDKGWTKKHIEKKRRYLKLKRTDVQKKRIHKRNTDNGLFKICVVKRWLKTGQAPEGDIRFWLTQDRKRLTPFIKVNNRFVHWARHVWIQNNGMPAKGMNVVFKNNNPTDLRLENLELISNEELMKRNSLHNLPKPILEMIWLRIRLDKNINKHLKRIKDEK